jgi:5-(carboxyamino)imidazole ribonucleotide synthase
MSKKLPVLGIIGGGQLGSMLCEAAGKINVKTVVFSDDKESPAKNFCNRFIYSKYDDLNIIKKFSNLVDLVTFEFENIPYEILNLISKDKNVIPDPKINQILQNRKKEKSFLNKIGIKTTNWALIESKEDILKNVNLLPGILKTCTLGYDGKGQRVINNIDDIKSDWCFSEEYILEKKVDLKKEISVIITRYANGNFSIYEPIENVHKEQILQNSKIPAIISKEILEQSQTNAKTIVEKLNYIGTMCIEYFINEKNELLLNEVAPRVHNSGHLTINAFNISQFENHIRAVCNLKKIDLNKNSNAEMINILGHDIENYRNKSLKSNEFFYDYLKKEIKNKRKMGHLTILKN